MGRLVSAVVLWLLIGAAIVWVLLRFTDEAYADTFIDEQTPVAISAQVSCTGVSSIVIPGKPAAPVQKHAWTVKNQSATDVFVCYGVTCTTLTGLRLQQNEGIVEQTYTGAVSCITGGGVATLATVVR